MNREKKSISSQKEGDKRGAQSFLKESKITGSVFPTDFTERSHSPPMVNDECHLWCFVWLFWGKKTNNVDNQCDNFFYSEKSGKILF